MIIELHASRRCNSPRGKKNRADEFPALPQSVQVMVEFQKHFSLYLCIRPKHSDSSNHLQRGGPKSGMIGMGPGEKACFNSRRVANP